MDTLLSRITIDPAVCHGKPCVRGLCYPVDALLELLSSGMTIDEILADYEDLERDDLLAVLAFAARLARTRYLCKRLRARLPNVKIVVGRWGLKDGVEQNQEQLLEAGADQVETTLHETQTHLSSLLPVLGHEGAQATANGAVKGRTGHALIPGTRACRLDGWPPTSRSREPHRPMCRRSFHPSNPSFEDVACLLRRSTCVIGHARAARGRS